MTAPLALPLTVMRAAPYRTIAPLMLALAVGMGGTLYLLFNYILPPAEGLVLLYQLLPLGFVALDVGALLVLYRTLQPAAITLSEEAVTVTPMRWWGGKGRKMKARSLQAFDTIQTDGTGLPPNAPPRLVLKARDGQDIVFDAPRHMDAETFADQLGEALKLKRVATVDYDYA